MIRLPHGELPLGCGAVDPEPAVLELLQRGGRCSPPRDGQVPMGSGAGLADDARQPGAPAFLGMTTPCAPTHFRAAYDGAEVVRVHIFVADDDEGRSASRLRPGRGCRPGWRIRDGADRNDAPGAPLVTLMASGFLRSHPETLTPRSRARPAMCARALVRLCRGRYRTLSSAPRAQRSSTALGLLSSRSELVHAHGPPQFCLHHDTTAPSPRNVQGKFTDDVVYIK